MMAQSIIHVVNAIASVYGRFPVDDRATYASFLFEGMAERNIDPALLAVMVKQYIKQDTSSFRPTVGQLLNYIDQQMNAEQASGREAAAAAWQECARRCVINRLDPPELWQDELAYRALELFGIDRFRQRLTADEMANAAQYREIYLSLEHRQRVKDNQHPAIAAAISDLTKQLEANNGRR